MLRRSAVLRGLAVRAGVPWMVVAAALGGRALAADGPDYKNTSLPFEQRAAAYLKQMTTEEKCQQMQMASPGIPRLGIPSCEWWSEASHGVARAQRATVYPDPIAMAASWDPALLKKVADATADEARIKYSEVKDSPQARSQWYHGIILWSPTINMARDPRWGRVEETYGEDPCLTSQLGVAFCQGVQGDDPKYLKTVATPKHFAMHSQEAGRFNSSFPATDRVLREYYLPAFEACIHEGGAQSIMSSHNGINGVPNAVNKWLLTDVLRNDWDFKGAVVTDYRELEYLVNDHHVATTPADAAAMAINAGVDILSEDRGVPEAVQNALLTGKLKMDVLDRAILRGLMVKLKLGMMDPPDMVPFTKISPSVVGSKEHIELARQMAAEGTVLLKNDEMARGYGLGKLLPLDLRKISSVAVLGQYAGQTQLGTYIAGNTQGFGTTQFTAGPIANPLPSIQSLLGDRVVVRNELFQDMDACEKAAAESDVTILVLGINHHIENEGIDRTTLDLPFDQQRFLERIAKANPATVVVLQGGSPIACGWLKDHVPAIVMMWYAGEQGGTALADVLLGRVNPSGRLPITFYNSVEDLPPMADYEIEKGRTYMYLKKPADFVFGHGLSYTTFSYGNLKIGAPAGTGINAKVTVSVDVTNSGAMDGEEVVQLYVSKLQSAVTRPVRQLKDFSRVSIAKGATKTVKLEVALKDMAYWNSGTHAFVAEPGAYEVEVGASTGHIRATGEFQVK